MKKKLILEAELRIRTVSGVWKRILGQLQTDADSGEPLEIDCSQVKTLDGAGLQLIIYLLQQAGKFPSLFRIGPLASPIRKSIIQSGFTLKQEEV